MSDSAKIRTLVLAACIALVPFTVHAQEEPIPVRWDPEASQELAEALHEMHEVWNSGDIAGLKELMLGDDVLVSFELDPATHQAVRLEGKEQIDAFVDSVVTHIDSEDAVSSLEEPVLNCRATDSFGVCTEECTVHLEMADGTVRTDRLLSTAVAVKYERGWRWIQWHMSVGQPTRYYTSDATQSER